MRIGEKHFPVYGVDIGKSLFHVCGCDETGKPTFRIKLRRDALLTFFYQSQAGYRRDGSLPEQPMAR